MIKKRIKAYSFSSRSFTASLVWDKEKMKKTVKLNSPIWFQNEINKFNVGDPLTMSVTNKKPKRTLDQNNYYWGVYLPLIATETGNDDMEYLHEYFKQKFLSKGTKMIYGEAVSTTKSTTTLTTGQFCGYIIEIEVLTGVLAPPTENYGLPELIRN